MDRITSSCLCAAFATLAAQSPAQTAQTVRVDLVAAPGVADLAPGVRVGAWLYGGTLPGQVLRARQGQTLRVRFRNDLPEPTSVHWHGQPVRLGMDGVPDVSRPAVAPGQEFVYELTDLVPGTYWYHPHAHGMQLDVGLAGVLIVDPANAGDDPSFDLEQTVVLDDWTSRLGGTFGGHLINGRTSDGQAPIDVQPGQRLRLRVINASAVTNYVFALDGHSMTVTHADGNRVQPVVTQAIPIGIGERYDVLVDCNNPGVWSLAAASITDRRTTLVRGVLRYAGQTQAPPPAAFVPPNLATGVLFDYAQLAAFFPVPPIVATPDRSYTAMLGMRMTAGGMVHTINGQSWPNVTPFIVSPGDRVQLTMTGMGMPGMGMAEYHPMHLHGHFFRLLGTAGGTASPPLKDTVLIRPGSSFQVQWIADNPGRWMFHCHNAEHLATGMMTTFDYTGDADGDGLASRIDMEPTAATPVVAIPDHAWAFAPGASDGILVQWTPGEVFALFVGFAELGAPLAAPPLGVLELDPTYALPLGVAATDAAGVAHVPYTIPGDPGLVGLRLGLQGAGATPLVGGLRLSTYQRLSIR